MIFKKSTYQNMLLKNFAVQKIRISVIWKKLKLLILETKSV